MKRAIYLSILSMMLIAILAGCVQAPRTEAPAATAAPVITTQPQSQELVVYSGRKETAIKPVTEAFTRTTGIKVNLKVGKTSGLANEIIQERENPRGDIFVATEAGVNEILAKEGVLAPYVSPEAKDMPPEYKSGAGYWTGISGRARVIIYNKDLVKEGEVPKSVFQLTDPRWKGKAAIAATRERTTLSWVSSILDLKGEEFTKNYISTLVANDIKILPDNSDVWQGVGKGEFAIGLTNSPNYHLAIKANYPVGVVYPDQGDGGVGALVNPNTVAIIKGARNAEAARKFVDFILGPEAQALLNKGAYEIPLVPGADPGEVRPLKDFRQSKVSQQRLAELADPTLALLAKTSTQW
ncbi:MAG: extracellular solute-binding protein [Euryarchaeota archaeon]|nr:extracellular solute-binding protein [Euryarchaeota archaeon]